MRKNSSAVSNSPAEDTPTSTVSTTPRLPAGNGRRRSDSSIETLVMNVLVLNAGSSSLKFQVIATDIDRIAKDGDERLSGGQVERVGCEASGRRRHPVRSAHESAP